ncbi:hypothetical protein SUGI_0600640 [Cryptomeria japonica]|uniref:uncharacterized protein LOC131033288 isoform X2 n=1 Tax=Cryptomeria japonica TaxID=3369 RepID=UPI00241482D6|nr:uncharacterized protein LOC131033288 isoform X2 [Cryptomeria japonica]GLJ30356.1 hypothetical protein SUGI_0600640 [Cryptomeria japonica]
MLVMLLQASGGSDNHRWINILIWFLFIREYLEEEDCSESQKLSCCVLAMSTKLHQKLVEDIRLQKRLLGLIDERNNVIKEQRGSYHSQALRQEIEAHEKRLVNVRSSWDDDGDKTYAWDDRRNSSRRRRDGRETSRGRHKLAPAAHETLTSSKPVKPLPDLAICYYSNSDYHRQQQRDERYKVNSINKNANAAASSGIGARHQNANDERAPGAFTNSMHILATYNNNSKNFRKFQDHHRRHNRSLDLDEVDASAIQRNAQATSFIQISKDALKLGDILKRQQGNTDGDLLKGAMDLEESLRILARLQKSTGGLKNVEKRRQSVDLKELLPFSKQKEEEDLEEGPRRSFDGWREPPRLSLDGREFGKSSNRDLRDAIRASLSRQKLLYGKSSDNINFRPPDSDSVPNSGILQVVTKKRIPNVIARLMGLDEMPSDSLPLLPDAVPNRVDSSRSLEGERGLKPEKPRLQESIRRPTLQTAQPRDFVRKDVHVKAEEDDDTILAALKRMKQQAPPKPSFQEELSEKLKRLHSVEPQQERKTLKQILETMEVKGLLRPGADQSKQKVEDDLNHRETVVLKPVTARRVQEPVQEKGKPSKSSNKSVAKEPSSQSDIVIIKPLNADSSTGQRHAQSPPKATELHPEINPVKSTEPKKKNKGSTKSELGKLANDGQSKKKNSLSHPEGTLKPPKQRTPNGVAQKHSKSQLHPPSPSVLQEIKRRKSDRISKVNNKKVPSKPEKQKPVRSKAKESVSKPPRPAQRPAPTDRIPSKLHAKHAIPIPVQPISQNTSTVDMNDDTNEARSQLRVDRDEETPENRNVKSLQSVSQDENSESESSSGSIQHHNSPEESTSPIAVLNPPAEADALQDDEEETADDENEGEEDLSSLPNHLEGSDDSNNKSSDDGKNHSFAVSDEDPDPSNYADEKELMTAEEMNYKDYVRQILTRIPAFMNAEAVELAELYPRLYFKLEEQEAASISGQEDIKQGHSGDDLERQLVMDCIKELLKRKARLRLQMKQPVKLARMKRAPMGLKRRKSIQELVHELSDDIGDLMAYHNNLGGDFVQSALNKDLNTGNIGVNSIWNPSWDNGLYGEDEAQEIGRDVEKLIFDDLLEEVVLQLWVSPAELCSG